MDFTIGSNRMNWPSTAHRICLTLLAWIGISAHSAWANTSVKLGAVTQITGPQDLDLEGEFVYAINFSADDPVRTVRGVNFTPDRLPIPGATLVGPQSVTPWQAKPEFGSSADANQLEEILHDIRWANTGGGERLRATLRVNALDEYKLQILISGNVEEDRRWDIRVNGLNAVDEITSLGVSPGQHYAVNRATLYTYQFVAPTTNVVVEMGTLFGNTDGGDRNPIWQALTLERVTIPPTPDDIVLAPAGGRVFARQTAGIGHLQVIDRKSAASHDLSLVSGAGDADNAKFTLIDGSLFPRPFDFRQQPPGSSFTVRVRATDRAATNRWLEKAFSLAIVAPNAPKTLNLDATAISASAQPGALLARMAAGLSDAFDQATYQLVSGAGSDDNAACTVVGDQLRLQTALPSGQTALRIRLRATELAGLFTEQSFLLPLQAPQLRLNEIFSGAPDAPGGLPDEAGELQDWIEIYNELPQWVDLSQWHLTDDPKAQQKWTFPTALIPPHGFLTILADGKGVAPNGSDRLHANFSLAGSGEWLALVWPDGLTLASTLDAPEQFPGVAYGYAGNPGAAALGYLTSPTPGTNNATAFRTGKNEVTFNRPHGFFQAAFALELSATVPGSVIRYTLDGSPPSAANGSTYSGPITVTPSTVAQTRGTRIVRAIALQGDAARTPIATQTYLFVTGISNPLVEGIVNQGQLVSSITRSAVYGPILPAAFLALPAVSVVLPGGIPGSETPASIELFDPEAREAGFQIDAGIEATGTTSLASPKLSMAATFRRAYGQSELKYPLFARGSRFPRGAATQFKKIRLRSHSHDTFFWLGTQENPPVPYGNPPVTRSGDAQLTRNPWIDEMQLMMGQPGKHGRQVHLYLNGAYHGIYHIHEHPDDDYLASYYPGGSSDFHFTGAATTGSDHGNGDNWTKPWQALKASLNNYPQARRWIDVTNLCDYMLLSFYAGNDWDWSAQHNWSAAGPTLPDRGGWKFFQQDSDVTLQDVKADCTDQDVPDGVFTALMRQPDFRVLFRDRAYLHCFNNGALTPARAGGLYHDRMNEISNAIVAETARWQPTSSVAKLPWDRDQEWLNEWNYLRNTFFPQRHIRLIEQLRKHSGWWPVEPPAFTLNGGRVPGGSVVEVTNKIGSVYYTIDGSDPRLPGGKISPSALLLSTNPLVIDQTRQIRARVFAAADWSALVEVAFIPNGTPLAASDSLALTEIQYHPQDDAAPEFLEFQNTSAAAIDLSGVTLSNAVSYVFPAGTVLAASERLVVTKDPTLFNALYLATNSPYFRSPVRSLGPWLGSLSNAGETLTVLAPQGDALFSCTYGVTGGWPKRADGLGSSLELNSDPLPSTAGERSAWLSDARHWHPSVLVHGSPGWAGSPAASGVILNEVYAASPVGDTDAVELMNATAAPVSVMNWFLSDSLKLPRKYRFPADTGLPPGGRRVLRESDFNNPANPNCLTPFALNSDGDAVHLIEADAAGNLLRFADEIEFGPTPSGRSIGRTPDGTSRWALLQRPTLGQSNSAAEPGYDAWKVTAFRSDTPPDDTTRTADPDGDGLTNFAEYAFVLSPLVADGLRLELAGLQSDGSLRFRYRIRTDAPELTVRLEVSKNLLTWDPAGAAVEIILRTPDPDGSSAVVADLRPPAAGGTEPRFVRLRVQ